MDPVTIGMIISAASQIAGPVVGGIYSSKAAKKAKANVEEQKQENQNWYDRRYNEDPLQRSSAQRILTYTQDMLRKRNRAAAGKAAVTGGTQESVAAEKEASAKALADATSNIYASNEARKDNIEGQYRQRDANLKDRLAEIEQQRAKAIAQAITGVSSAASSLTNSLMGGGTTGATDVPTELTQTVNQAKKAKIDTSNLGLLNS